MEADPRLVRTCEPRLALSANLGAEWLIDTLKLAATGPDFHPLASATDLSRIEVEPAVAIDLASRSAAPTSPLDGIDTVAASTVQGSPDLLQQASELRHLQGLDGRGQTVVVIDSGVAWDHVTLGGGFGPGYRVVGGWDFAEHDADPYDDGPAGYHGTHVAGLLAGQSDGYSGVAPGADVVALRVFDDAGVGQLRWIESALQWVHENQHTFASPITTVNLSVGAALSADNQADAMSMLEDELQQLRDDQILVFAASGNLMASQSSAAVGVLYPASSPAVVAVSSVDAQGDLSDFAQRETGILASRGEAIAGAVPDHVFGWDGKVDDFARLDGTSMATPQVAAASMLVRQAMSDVGLEPSAEAILKHLNAAAIEKFDPLSGSTFRMIDLQGAIDSVRGTPPSSGPAIIERLDGSSSGEQVELDLRDGIRLRVGGLSYTMLGGAGPLVIDVAGGDDSLQILGSAEAERLIVHAESIQDGVANVSSISTNDFRIELRGFERVAFHGGGGADRATLFDSAAADTLTSHPSRATLQGTGFRFDVFDVPRIYVHGTAGGNDTAFLHDSSGDDMLAVRPQFTSLRSEQAFQLAYGFERVHAYATAGGMDRAELYDSPDDDTLSISSGRSLITGPGYHVSARGFASTTGFAVAGGFDVARLYASESASLWNVTEDRVQWTDPGGAVRIARGFERLLAFEQYEPIELTPPSRTSPPAADFAGAAAPLAERQADAARAVFDALGQAETQGDV
jgi:hypothetical protein